MSAKSRESASAIDRPFPPEVLKRARRIAEQYQVIVNCEEGHWYGRGLEMPNVFGDGKTVNQCVEDTRDALCGAVAVVLEQGRRFPAPARGGNRTTQVNVRLTAEEKILLESTAKRKGFSGLSDFIRAAAIESAK
jgi:predicted RNase H-like HicB family nuclease